MDSPIRAATHDIHMRMGARLRVAGVMLWVGLQLALAAQARTKTDAWQQAVALRDQLEASPAGLRTAQQYGDVLNSFRLIYHQNPAAAKAPAAVAAVADLLAEKGRVLADKRSLQAAIGQYEFLRQQYPDSPQVDNALLLEAEICRQDLKDIACAEEKFRAVIDSSPDSSFAEQASIELKEMEAERTGKISGKKAGPETSRMQADRNATTGVASKANPAHGSQAPQAQSSPAQSVQTQPVVPPIQVQPAPEIAGQLSIQPAVNPETLQPHKVVNITGMRHWSNPTSTRIAIDLSGKVEYEAARVPNPDRIFFDLHGAKLASSLNGHQVEVIDDGYLKRIRAAQFHTDVTRVVLDVTDVSQYSAFLLPNPWRLIIDIHSDKGASKQAIAQNKATANETLPTGASVPTMSAAEPVPPSTLVKGASKSSPSDNVLSDVAKLSSEPAKVPATAGPTSGPVSATVGNPTTRAAAGKTRLGTAGQVAPAFPPNELEASGASANQPAAGNASGAGKGQKRGKGSASNTVETADAASPPHAADPTADGQRSLVRALGLKVGRIVIDAGHGGHDSGTLGPGGIQEKDVVLDVALRVGKLLHQRLGAEIVYTRSDDTFIPLETRTAIANRAQADLFLSIHGNSSPEPSARGVETYYLNFTSDPQALDVAARENAVSTQSVHQLSDLVRQITLKDKIEESREFAADVDEGLYTGLKSGNPGLKDRGVKKAPFVVLIGAQMPSILAEISFLTNPDDADQLRQGPYRQRIAEALDAGVERYLRGLSGPRPGSSGKGRSSASLAASAFPAGR